MEENTFTVIITKEEDMFIAECPEVGTVSQGYSIDEAVANIKEATKLYLEEFPLKLKNRPIITFFDTEKIHLRTLRGFSP
ncbi:type II toxin-antitoxin system HicB family antitoxin [Candidatus Pacearchaeota archaeon]|nr:type II toxin-antitoxin system HicB family antitoxin [Candidatus Pacearchaeota archaeon]